MGGFNNGTPGQSGLRNVVRYDTPTIAGFIGIGLLGRGRPVGNAPLNYKSEIGDFKVTRPHRLRREHRSRPPTAASAPPQAPPVTASGGAR